MYNKVMSSENSPQRSALENLINENDRLRDTLNEVKREKEEALRNLRKS
jgi:hypothetical protein